MIFMYLTSSQIVSHLRACGLINVLLGAATTWRSCERNSSYTEVIVKIRIPAKCGLISIEPLEERYVYSDGNEVVLDLKKDYIFRRGDNFSR